MSQYLSQRLQKGNKQPQLHSQRVRKARMSHSQGLPSVKSKRATVKGHQAEKVWYRQGTTVRQSKASKDKESKSHSCTVRTTNVGQKRATVRQPNCSKVSKFQSARQILLRLRPADILLLRQNKKEQRIEEDKFHGARISRLCVPPLSALLPPPVYFAHEETRNRRGLAKEIYIKEEGANFNNIPRVFLTGGISRNSLCVVHFKRGAIQQY